MSDTTLNSFVAAGTAAERAAFTPTPPTPASGNDPGYFWFETDTATIWCWDAGTSAWVQAGGAGGISPDSAPWLDDGGLPGWDPLYCGVNSGTLQINLSNSNKTATPTSGGPYNHMCGTPAQYTGKLYYEMVPSATGFTSMGFTGSQGHSKVGDGNVWGAQIAGQVGWTSTGAVWVSRLPQATNFQMATVSTYVGGDRLCFALDLDAGLFWLRTNSGLWNNDAGADPATGTNGLTMSWAYQFSPSRLIWPGGSGTAAGYDMYLLGADHTQPMPSGFSPWAS